MSHVFTEGDLNGYLRDLDKSVDRRLQEWDRDEFLSLPEEELIKKLTKALSVDCPVLLRDQVEQLPVQERTVDGQRVVQFGLAVPFEGSRNLLHYIPPGVDVTPNWNCTIHNYPSELRITKEVTAEESASAAAYLTQVLDDIERVLEHTRREVTAYNDQVQAALPAQVATRRAELAAIRDAQQKLGFPVRQERRSSRNW